ncbi:putative metal-dependent hydrolase, partial [Vibrio parahaemolyticus V-223/04]
CI